MKLVLKCRKEKGKMTKTVTPSMVKELRERTGVGMGKCKEALDQTNGDIEGAIDLLRKAGAASAVKKGDRETKEGLVGVAEDAKGIALVEINAETDFVTKNERFQEFVKHVAHDALQSVADDVASLCGLSYSKKEGMTIEEARIELIQVLGENMNVRRVLYISKKPNASYGVYTHLGGQIVTLVEITGSADVAAIAKDVAMHVAAEAPEFLTAADIPEAVKEREAEVARGQIQGKPADMVEKIVLGKLKAFADQACLVSQKFIKDPSNSVAHYVEAAGKKMGASLTVTQFVRWQIGAA